MTAADVLAWLLELVLDGPPPRPAVTHEARALASFATASVLELEFDKAETFHVYVYGPIEAAS